MWCSWEESMEAWAWHMLPKWHPKHFRPSEALLFHTKLWLWWCFASLFSLRKRTWSNWVCACLFWFLANIWYAMGRWCMLMDKIWLEGLCFKKGQLGATYKYLPISDVPIFFSSESSSWQNHGLHSTCLSRSLATLWELWETWPWCWPLLCLFLLWSACSSLVKATKNVSVKYRLTHVSFHAGTWMTSSIPSWLSSEYCVESG